MTHDNKEQVWDLCPVSHEEFKERLTEQVGGYSDDYVIAESDSLTDDECTFIHYTCKDSGAYLGSIKMLDSEAEYLLPELVDEQSS